MRFINKGEPLKIRLGTLREGYSWFTLEHGESRDLPEEIGKAYKLEEVKSTEGTIGETKVETKQIEDQYTPDDLFFKELKSIKGIGQKTAKDIVTWGTREKLVEYIKEKKELPFRDDVVRILGEKYG